MRNHKFYRSAQRTCPSANRRVQDANVPVPMVPVPTVLVPVPTVLVPASSGLNGSMGAPAPRLQVRSLLVSRALVRFPSFLEMRRNEDTGLPNTARGTCLPFGFDGCLVIFFRQPPRKKSGII